NAVAKRQLANVYLSGGLPGPALKLADDLIKMDNKDNEAHILKGQALLVQKKNLEAIAELQSAANSAPGSATARYYLGAAYQQDRKSDQAELAWNEAIRLDPK